MDISWFTLKTLYIAVVTSTVYYVISLWLRKRAKFSSLSRIPSPPGLPIIGHLHHFLGTFRLSSLLTMAKTFDESGIFHLELVKETCVFIFKPKYLKTFYTMNSMEKAFFYRPIDEITNPSTFLSHGAIWKKLRKILLINFFGTPSQILLKNFQRGSDNLVEELREKANGEPFPFHELALCATGSTISYSAGYEKPQEWKHYFTDVIPYLILQAARQSYNLLYYLKPIYKLTENGGKYYRTIRDLHSYCEGLFDGYKKRLNEMLGNGDPVPKVYMYNVLKNHSEEPVKLMMSELMTLITGGTETTGNAIGYLLILLGMFPKIQDKILEEDREILSNLQGREQTVEDLRKYKYLECVIKETLRLFPVSPIIGRKLEEDTKFGDYVIPKGTNIIALLLYASRDPKIFPEPLAFKPERFFKENESSIPPYAYNPFSAGPRSCPGKHYAMMSLKTMTTAILRHYRVLPVYKNLEEVIINAKIGVTLSDKNNFPIKLVTRA